MTVLQGIRYAEANDFTWDVLGGRFLHAKLLESRGDMPRSTMPPNENGMRAAAASLS